MNGSREQPDYTFPKSIRLSSGKAIEDLFASSKAVKAYPLKIVYTTTDPAPELPQVLISVPKRKFRKAVDRNRLKRRLREAVRLNKNLLAETGAHTLGIIYVGDQTLSFKLIEDKLILAFARLNKEIKG